MIISGKELSTRMKADMAAQVATFPEKYGRVPHLVVILVGEDPASQSYVRGKGKACEAVGRQPESKSAVTSTLILGCALAETTGLYGLIIGILLIFVAPGSFVGILMANLPK